MTFADAATLAEFVGDDSLDGARGAQLLESASAIIRNHCRQTLHRVENDEVELRGTRSQKLMLPERPVVDVTSVKVGGVEVSDWTRVRDGLFRNGGWGGPSTLVEVTYSHGFSEDSPAWKTLEAVCLQVAARAAANPQSFNSFTAANGDGIGFGGGGTGTQVLGLTSAEQAIIGRFHHEKASA
jgi:hypothetical protein